MRYFAGYMGCLGVFLLLMGLAFHALVLPQIKARKKSFLEWIMIAVFGLGMLESMAVKPGGGNAPQAPRRSPPQQTEGSTNTVEIATTTNTPPWESALAFSYIKTTPSNVQLTIAWPMGFYNYDPLFDLFIAYPTLTNDWQWITCQSAASSDSNCTFTVTPSALGLAKLPPALFARVTERTEVCETMDDPDGNGVDDLQERFDGSDPYHSSSFRITRTVKIDNKDNSPQTTNYVAQGLTKEWNAADPFHRMAGTSENMTINANAISGAVYVKCFRDFNRNGVYDEDAEPLYVYTIQNETPSSKGTVNVEFKDKDGDTIPDSIEWSEGTDINDKRSYCYSPRLTVTGIFTTTNHLYAQPFFGTNALDTAHAVCTNQEEYYFGHFSTTNSERLVIKYWDDSNANLTLDDSEPYSFATVNPQGHETALVYDLPYSKFDANNNRLPDWWEIATGLSTNSAPYNCYTDNDNDGLINLHEYWTGCDPLTPDGSNTVLSILARSIDDRLTEDPTGRMNVYNNYCKPDFYPNTNCWTYGIDLSCASPTNSYGGTQRAGTAISSQHIVLANHFPLTNDTIVVFKANDGNLISRQVIARRHVADDVYICLLNTNLPHTVSPAYLLPNNFNDYIGNGYMLPMLMLDQDEHAIVANVLDIPTGRTYSSGIEPSSPTRKSFFETVISGDSGNPTFLVAGTNVILLHTFHYGGGGSGPSLVGYADEIQSAMDDLSIHGNRPLEHLRFFNFSTYPKLQREVK